MWFANDLQSCDDQFQMEMRVFLLNVLYYAINDLKFLLQANSLSLFVKQQAEYVSELDDENVLRCALGKDLLQQQLEELCVLS